MGVPGLLLGLKAHSKKGNVRDYLQNRVVAVDASSWLHRSVYSIADHFVEQVLERGQDNHRSGTTVVIDERSKKVASNYVIQRCQELLVHAGATKICLVMDGQRCPMKLVTNQERDRRRRENLQEARRLKQKGDDVGSFEKYKACLKVPTELAQAVAVAVNQAFVGTSSKGSSSSSVVEIVWSPYEADAQLVQLCQDGRAHVVVTEDSDVLVYQAACRVSFPILFKLDRHTGSCDVLSMDWLLNGNEGPPFNEPNDEGTVKDKASSGVDAVLQVYVARERRDPGLGCRLFVQSCVLTGCDYAPNQLSGVGLVTAFKHLRNAVHCDSSDRFRHVLNQLPSKARHGINAIDYEELLAKSEAVFYRHPVRRADGTLAFLSDTNPAKRSHDHPPHHPCMERFGGDWTFLGRVSGNGTLLPPTAGAPVQEAAANGHDHHHLRPCANAPMPTVVCHSSKPKIAAPSLKTMRLVGDELVVESGLGPMKNPYQRSRKHKQRDLSSRKPLSSLENKAERPVGRRLLAGNKAPPNPFSAFSHSRSTENRTSALSETCQTVGQSEGIGFQGEAMRFVERNFGPASKMPIPLQNEPNRSVSLPRDPPAASILSHDQKVKLALCRKAFQVSQVLTGVTGKVGGAEHRTSIFFALNREPPACNVRVHCHPAAASVPSSSGVDGSRDAWYSSVPDGSRLLYSLRCEPLHEPSGYKSIPPPCELPRMSPSRSHVGLVPTFASIGDYLGSSLDTTFQDWEAPDYPGCQAPPVTLESPDRETGSANEPFDLSATTSDDQPLAAGFPYYDDFTFSPSPSTHRASSSDDVAGPTSTYPSAEAPLAKGLARFSSQSEPSSSYPSAEAPPSKGLARFSSQSRYFGPKPNSSIGPAKTVRHQFAAFQPGLAPFRNRAPPTSFQTLPPSRSGRGSTNCTSSSAKRRRTEPSPQSNTLLNYFSVY